MAPSALEIEELIERVRRDPGSPAFVALANAYLALGRPRDAVAVGNVGLAAAPENWDGRFAVARAYADLHQWKESQGELLKIVKVERGNRAAFALLGEVLMRREDYERAVPVLQHAQNLDPTSPHVLSLLKRARANAPLDPPPPIPTAIPPRGEAPAPVVRSGGLNIASSLPMQGDPTDVTDPSAAPGRASGPPPLSSPPMRSAPVPLPPMEPAPAPRPAPRVTAPQAVPEGVRPRVIAAKQQNAAQASLRNSAAVGENYINDLLMGGLLDVGVARAPEATYDLRPDRKWGRSARRAFIVLFALLFAGLGGGTAWYFWAKQKRAEAVAKLQTESREQAKFADFLGLETSLGSLGKALEKDNDNTLTFAYVAESAGLEALLYGTDTGRVDEAIRAAQRGIKNPTDAGAAELTIGKAAYELARLGRIDSPDKTLNGVTESLDAYLKGHDDDSPHARMARWLKGRAQLAAGQRKNAKALFKQAADGDTGLAVAMIDFGDLLIDDGAFDQGMAQYERALKLREDHPLAIAGRALARAEARVDVSAALDDINVSLDKPLGPRVAAYRELATAFAQISQEDYPRAYEALGKATGITEPRFLARVAWLELSRGHLAAAAKTRGAIAWYGKGKPEDDSLAQLVDAGLLVASGLPAAALELTDKLANNRAKVLRLYALLDMDDTKSASAAASEADELLKKSPEDNEIKILREQAIMLSATGKPRDDAAEALERLARKVATKMGRYALGMALYQNGLVANNKEWLSDAKRQLMLSLEEISDEAPHPMAYRSHTLLAEILIGEGDLDGASKQLDEGLKLNSGYFPARATSAQLKLRRGEADAALALIEPMANEAQAATPKIELIYVEALVSRKDVSPEVKTRATEILTRIKDKIVPASEASRVAALIDPKLPETLGLPAADAAPGAAPAPVSVPSHRRRHR
jgi:predicted Zn-dependent protease